MHFRVVVVSVALVLLLAITSSEAQFQQQEPLESGAIDPAQQQQQVAPEVKPHVSILKQISQINKDGSYTYGFEASDGSFRVETRDVNGHVKGRYGYIDEFGEVKAVAYESGTKQGFAPRGQHLPVLPRPSKSGGNIGEDDEFGTDEDWNSVDADQDGQPDPPRPKDQRPVVTTKPPRVTPPPQARPAAPPARLERPEPPVFIPAEPAPQPERPAGRPAFVEAAPQQERPAPRPALIPVEEVPRSFRPFQPFQQQPPPQFQFQQPQQFQLQPQQFRFQPQFRDDRAEEQQQQFVGPIFPPQFRSIPPGFPQQRSFSPVPFPFQQQPQPTIRE